MSQCYNCGSSCSISPSATGNCAFAAGDGATASGNLSIALNGSATNTSTVAILGSASGDGAVAIGGSSTGLESYAIGNSTDADGDRSFVIGEWAIADGSYHHNYIFGAGEEDQELVNDISNSIMLGINSNLPTLFIEGAEGTSGSWGKVGIGTTSPIGILHLREESGDDTELIIEKYGNTAAGVHFYSGGDNLGYLQINDDEHMLLYHRVNNKPIRFAVRPGGTLTEIMRIAGTGNVGIGPQTAPSAKLHVTEDAVNEAGIARFDVSDASGYIQIENKDGDATEFAGMIIGNTSVTDNEALTLRAIVNDSGTQPSMEFNARTSGGSAISSRPLFAWTNFTTTEILMDASGNLGIGTVAPVAKLTVEGDIYPNTDNMWDLGTNTGTTRAWQNIYSYNYVTVISDKRKKENIEPLDYGLKEILSLNPVKYTYKSDAKKSSYDNRRQLGLIAQEALPILPEIVNSANDTAQSMGIKYGALIPILINAIKEQQDEIERLKVQVQLINQPLTSNEDYKDHTSHLNEFILLKNDPNPFNDFTDIQYEVENCDHCEIIVMDINGKLIKRLPLNNNSGKVRIYCSEIGNGVFSYSLIENGKVLKTQKMISTK